MFYFIIWMIKNTKVFMVQVSFIFRNYLHIVKLFYTYPLGSFLPISSLSYTECLNNSTFGFLATIAFIGWCGVNNS